MLQRWWHRQPLPLVLHHRQKSLHMREEKKEKMINYLAKVTTERRQKLTRQKDLSVKGWAKKKELLSWVRLLFLQCHLWHSLHSRGLFIQPFFQLERIGLFHASTPSCRVTLFDELMNLFYLCFAQKRVHRLECKATDSGSNNSATSLICVLCMAGTGRRGKTTINHQSSCTSSLSLSLFTHNMSIAFSAKSGFLILSHVTAFSPSTSKQAPRYMCSYPKQKLTVSTMASMSSLSS